MLTHGGAAGTPRVLFVDDEPAVLEGIARVLFDADLEIHGETLPVRALTRLSVEGPFDVVVSDMRMPEMDGAAFLSAASRASPDTARILLTGQADVAAAVAAVNEGHILRFLQKPCDPGELAGAIDEAVRQRRATLAERELLESTLAGAVRAMSEMLALLAPEIFRRASALARAAAFVAERLRIEPRWSIEVAARLCHVGCVALPPDLLARERRGEQLTPDERALVDAEPETGYRLLINIPRLEGVAAMVRHQRRVELPDDLPPGTARGARVLRILLDVEQRVYRGARFAEARRSLRRGALGDDALILDALNSFTPADDGPMERAVAIKQIVVGMVLAEDVLTRQGAVIVGKGAEVTQVVRERLQSFARGIGVREPVCVRGPS